MSKRNNIIFLCTGNSCRSPMAEGIARKVFTQYGLKYDISSYGTLNIGANPPAEYAIELCNAENIDITHHRSQQLSLPAAENADLILVMEHAHLNWIEQNFGRDISAKAFLITEYGNPHPIGEEIPDPIGKSINMYREIFNMLKIEIERIARYEFTRND